MNKALIICALTLPAYGQTAAMNNDDMAEVELSTEISKTEYSAEEEETVAEIQESDEDLAGFVQDYVRKDSSLKGAFLMEEPGGGKLLKLSLDSVAKTSAAGPDNSKIIEAAFKSPDGRKHRLLFHLRSAGFGGIDIYKIEFKKEEKTEKPLKSKAGDKGK